MKEIGGYFEFEQLINNEYYKDLVALNNRRLNGKYKFNYGLSRNKKNIE